MNREILFKAKHIHAMSDNRNLDGNWTEGYLSDEEYINNGVADFLIDKNTICQYTGLTDKNGKKIFEGDVVRYCEICGEVKFGLYEANFSLSNLNQGFYVEFPEDSLYRGELGYWRNKVVVVGNIYDNSELLEEISECETEI